MEKVLRGNRGGKFVEVDGLGVETRPSTENPPVPGRNLKLTIDLELQAAATAALEEGLRFSNEDRYLKDQAEGEIRRARSTSTGRRRGGGRAGCAQYGEVLALASYPLYDNQLFVEGISTRKYLEYTQDENRPLINKAAADHFPPGSMLKIFMAMAGLQGECRQRPDLFHLHQRHLGSVYLGRNSKGDRYLCWLREDGGHGTLDLVEAHRAVVRRLLSTTSARRNKSPRAR